MHPITYLGALSNKKNIGLRAKMVKGKIIRGHIWFIEKRNDFIVREIADSSENTIMVW